ncbi:hypothetical protein [Mangrovibacterium diazotrophicum]|uniref:Uncharacterized protein n=1 Tax=Mangrovibacterium diazotrophicum TaxID=1261403 RepID=A0A419VWL6_9BACT|nr:hypothetical protein [Mangrovibacterium diazotrophicum]RKD86466.1 hypothetical protein BC643_4159 [Mangrovibacterium diazotrophicum]
MKKHLYCTLFMLLALPLMGMSQTTCFVLIKEKKLSWACKTDAGYETFHLPSKLPYETRKKILEVKKSHITANSENTVRIKDINLKPDDYLIIYQETYQNKECGNYSMYFAFPVKDPSLAEQKIAERQKTSLLKESYQSHKIVEIIPPYKSDEPGFFQQINNSIIKYLKENGEDDLEREYQKSTAIGVRG